MEKSRDTRTKPDPSESPNGVPNVGLAAAVVILLIVALCIPIASAFALATIYALL